MTFDLLPDDLLPDDRPARIPLAAGAVLLTGFALQDAAPCLSAIGGITAEAPFRHMTTPGGRRMSAEMSNCGALGWVTDRKGYRYTAEDPETGRPWPAMPPLFRDLAIRAAAEAGFAGFSPDCCLINRYTAGARMSLHQDLDETDFSAPIVSVSFGLAMTFLFGGLTRNAKPRRIPLHHGDVAVWGGPARKTFHGVAPLKAGTHPATGAARYNLTFRTAG